MQAIYYAIEFPCMRANNKERKRKKKKKLANKGKFPDSDHDRNGIHEPDSYGTNLGHKSLRIHHRRLFQDPGSRRRRKVIAVGAPARSQPRGGGGIGSGVGRRDR